MKLVWIIDLMISYNLKNNSLAFYDQILFLDWSDILDSTVDVYKKIPSVIPLESWNPINNRKRGVIED